MEGLWGSRSARQKTSCNGVLPPRRRDRFLRRRPTGPAIDHLRADLARLEMQQRKSASSTVVDPAERALLIELYSELIASVEGPVVPFPVEFLVDPSEAMDRAEPAELVDLDRYRQRRSSLVAAEFAAADRSFAAIGEPRSTLEDKAD